MLTSMYPPHHYGGYELTCRDVVDCWRAAGHEVTVLTTNVRRPHVAEPEPAYDVRRALRFYWDDHVVLNPPLRTRLSIERANQRALADTINTFRPDVVSVWQMGAMSLGLLTTLADQGIPVVLNVHDDWLEYAPWLDAWTRLFADRPRLGRLVEHVTGVVTRLPDISRLGAVCFVSNATRDHARRTSRWTYPRSTVVWNGIDPAVFTPGTDKSWTWRLLYVGRIDPRKGIDDAIRALPLLPEATLAILGGGDADYLADLRALVADLGLTERVTFDEVARDELAACYRSADVVVFPSIWDEPFGLVPLEAMSCGTPVVTTATGGSAEFSVDNRNCLVIPPRDPAALAAAVQRLADDAALRARLIDGGLTTTRELTVERLAEVLATWHVAAAAGYPDGVPPDRPLPRI